jgi:hypothetical protein
MHTSFHHVGAESSARKGLVPVRQRLIPAAPASLGAVRHFGANPQALRLRLPSHQLQWALERLP